MPEMRLRTIVLDEDETPTSVGFYASPDVAATLEDILDGRLVTIAHPIRHDLRVGTLKIGLAAKALRATGKMSPRTAPNYEVTSAIYDCLAGALFNRFWENGVDDFLDGPDA